LEVCFLHEPFCPALAFVKADSDDSRNPQHFLYVSDLSTTKRAIDVTNNSKNKTRNFVERTLMGKQNLL
jgi:hypothetical protein